MLDPGVHNPRRNMLICLGVTLVAWAFLAWGVVEMYLAGWKDEVGSGAKIGFALLPAILGPAMAYNFWRGIKVFAAIRRGENEIGRWTVAAADLPEFSAVDDARNAYGGEYLNDWAAPRALPPAGLEIVFVADGVLVGDVYFALVTTGMFKFDRVGMLADNLPAIEFRTITTWANRFTIRTSIGALRLPVPRHAADRAARIVEHFRRVNAGEVVVNPDFYRGRMRFGLIAAPICFAVAAIGFVVLSTGVDTGGAIVPLLLVVSGIVFGIAMLILALAAKLLSQAQRRKR